MKARLFVGPCSTVLTVAEDGQVRFEVEGSFNWKKRSNVDKLAISRWLFTTWKKEVLPLGEYFYCQPHRGDVIGSQIEEGEQYRRSIYKRLGFVSCPQSKYGPMQYGTPPNKTSTLVEMEDNFYFSYGEGEMSPMHPMFDD